MTLSPLSAAILATLLMYLLTALGAALVFPLRRFHPSVMNLLMALGAGIMLAASYLFAPCARADVRAFPPAKPAPDVQRRIFARRAARAVGGRAAFTPDAPNATVRRAPQNRSADWQHHPAQHSRRPGGRLRVRCFGVPRRGGVAAQRVDACHRHCAAKLPRRGGGQSAAPPRRLFLPPFVLLRTVIRGRSRRLRGFWAHCWRFASAPPCRCCFRSPAAPW